MWSLVLSILVVMGIYAWVIALLYNNEPVPQRGVPEVKSYNMYKSERFMVTGNRMHRITVTDRKQNFVYVFERNELAKFRRNFYSVTPANKEDCLLAIISNKTSIVQRISHAVDKR